MTIPYNMINRSYAPTIKRAGELGIGVIAMCPVAGGVLASPAPQLRQLLPEGAGGTTAAAALQFVLSNPDVSCACSGMATRSRTCAKTWSRGKIHGSQRGRARAHRKIMDEFAALGRKFCTGCGYCHPCPQRRGYPAQLSPLQHGLRLRVNRVGKGEYARMDAAKRAAGNCLRCGQCEPKCPNQIPIMETLKEVAKLSG